MSNRRAAFTLVELVMVIVIIGLLAAVVMPKFSDMKGEAQVAAEQAAVAAVQTGIKLAHLTYLTKGEDKYPDVLDAANNDDASEANPLFTNVIEDGVTDGNWKKTGKTSYEFKPSGAKYTYTPKTGKFTK